MCLLHNSKNIPIYFFKNNPFVVDIFEFICINYPFLLSLQMQGKHIHQPKLFASVTLDSLMPEHNIYRRLNAVLDLRFLYKATQSFYGTQGQASIDPVVFFKLLLVGYWNNVHFDR